MNTIDDILEILKTSQEKLEPMLEACGWTGLTEFTDEQAETLLAMKVSHEDKNRDYIEGYVRNIAHNVGISGTQFDEIHQCITQAGSSLLGYRDQFWQICQRVKDGVSPAEAIVPPQPVVEDTPPVADPIAQSAEIDEFMDRQAEAAMIATIKQIEGFADLAYEEQERLKELFLGRYRQKLAEKLLSPEFQAQFMQRMNASLEEGAKKPTPGELTGAPTPTPSLSSSS